MLSLIRSARVWIVKRTVPAAAAAAAKSVTQSTRNPKMSSANQICWGSKLRFRYAISDATATASRCRYRLPQVGLAHHAQRKEQPREAAMFRLKYPWVFIQTER